MFRWSFIFIWIVNTNCVPLNSPNTVEPSLKIINIFPNGAINVRINLPGKHGIQDVLRLRTFFPDSKRSDPLGCNYVGELMSDKHAAVSVSGCIGREDVTTTITSPKHPILTHVWKLYGLVEELKTVRNLASTFYPIMFKLYYRTMS